MNRMMAAALGLVLLVLTSTAAAAEEDGGNWYALAWPYIYDDYYEEWRFEASSYGIAWNFPTRAAAISAAIAECEKRSGSKCKEYYDDVDHDRCFAIVRSYSAGLPGLDRFFLQYGHVLFVNHPPFQTEEEARRVVTEEARVFNRRHQRDGYDPRSSLEMVACSGDPRNRNANQ